MSVVRRIRLLVVALSPVVCSLTHAEDRDRGLMPMPAHIKWGTGSLSLGTHMPIAVEGHTEPRLDKAIDRFLAHLSAYPGQAIRRVTADSQQRAKLRIRCQGTGQRIQSPEEDETYFLNVSTDQARLDAPTTVGVLRGLATLEQLLRRDGSGFVIPEVHVEDKPRFPWRGLLIDVCRHWQPITIIKRNLDAMAAVKLNVLHLHLTEDQGFRVESKRFPRLHERGSDGDYFTHKELREIVAYARDRGIRVVPEFDMPGHTTSWLVGHPELAAAPGPYRIERHWGVFDPCFDPTKESLYEFLESFLAEMTAIFPDPYLHVGGDEVNGNQWATNPQIQAFMKQESLPDLHALQAYFNRRVAVILAKYGRTMIGWDEILNEGLPENCVVQSWRGVESLQGAVTHGFDAILSNGYYLDHQRPASFHYLNDPDPDGKVSKVSRPGRILGGEACMWGEFVTPETIDSRIWPRMAAIAERLWSPAAVKNVDDMYRRLEHVTLQLDRIGAQHNSNYEAMLTRLADGQSIEALRVLADVVEPVKFYERSASRTYTSLTPLNRLVDAARPESEAARRFRTLVGQFLSDRADKHERGVEIRKNLARWQANHARLLPAIRSSELLAEVGPVSHNLHSVAVLGLQTMDLLESNRPPGEQWEQQAITILKNASEPHAEVEIAVIPIIKTLVETVSPAE